LVGEPFTVQLVIGNPLKDTIVVWQGAPTLKLEHCILRVKVLVDGRSRTLPVFGADICGHLHAANPTTQPRPEDAHRVGRGALSPNQVIRQWFSIIPGDYSTLFWKAGSYRLQIEHPKQGVLAKASIVLTEAGDERARTLLRTIWQRYRSELANSFDRTRIHRRERYVAALSAVDALCKLLKQKHAIDVFQYYHHRLSHELNGGEAHLKAIAGYSKDQQFSLQSFAYGILLNRAKTPASKKLLWNWSQQYPNRLR